MAARSRNSLFVPSTVVLLLLLVHFLCVSQCAEKRYAKGYRHRLTGRKLVAQRPHLSGGGGHYVPEERRRERRLQERERKRLHTARTAPQLVFQSVQEEPEVQDRKIYRIATIKQHILEQLNLKYPPNVTGIVPSTNPAIQDMIADISKVNRNRMPQYLGFQQDAEDLDTHKIFIPVEKEYPFNFKHSLANNIMYFKVNQGEVKSAVLHLFIKKVPVSAKNQLRLEYYNVFPPVRQDDFARLAYSGGHSEYVDHTKGSWTKFPVMQLVTGWAKDPDGNYGIKVDMKDMAGNQVAVTNATEMPEMAPILEVQFIHEGNNSKRNVRSSEVGQCSLGETTCCRYPLPINFTEHNFDFIVAPKVYMANFCNGKCQYLFPQQHLHMALVQKLHNATATYGPCCGAKELIPLNMLYYDHDRKIRFDTINDMVIDKCSCD